MRIFVAAIAQGELVVRGEEHHYVARVRRARTGDAIELVDGAGMRASAVITAITDEATTLAVAAPETIAAKPPFVRAVIPAIKGDRMDVALEKLVEVGADEIVIFPAQRAIVKLEDKREAKLVKYRAALQAAARQSGRAQIPAVRIADSLADALAGASAQQRIVLDPASDAPLVIGVTAEVTLVSGPEGGLAPGELEALARAGFGAVGLGPRILRAETAPVVAVALIRQLTGS
jgi:16S rRNA (uracil1498-N3)-methyltransferase